MMISFFKIVMKKSTRHLFYTVSTHSMKLNLSRSGGLSTKKFHPSASTRTAQLSVAVSTVRSIDLLNWNVKARVNTGQIRLERTSLVKAPLSMQCSSPIFVFVLRSERLPRLVKRKLAVLHAFNVGFQKVCQGCILLLVALLGLINILFQNCWLESLCYDCLSRATKIFDT